MVKKQSSKPGNKSVGNKEQFYQVASSDSEYNSDEINEQQQEAKRLQQIRASKLKAIQNRTLKSTQSHQQLIQAQQHIQINETTKRDKSQKAKLGNLLFEEDQQADELESAQIQDLDQLKYHIIKLMQAYEKKGDHSYLETKAQLLGCYTTLVHYFNYLGSLEGLSGSEVKLIREQVILKLAQIKTYVAQLEPLDQKFLKMTKAKKSSKIEDLPAESEDEEFAEEEEEVEQEDLEYDEEESEGEGDEEVFDPVQPKSQMSQLISSMMLNDSDQEAIEDLEEDINELSDEGYKRIKQKSKKTKAITKDKEPKVVDKEMVKQPKEGKLRDVSNEDLPEMFQQRLKEKKDTKDKKAKLRQREEEEALKSKDQMESSILRKTNYDIEKNRGLVRKRNNKIKNPRVKGKIRYQKALVKRKSMGVVLSRKDEGKRYEGELGLHTNYVKSVQL